MGKDGVYEWEREPDRVKEVDGHLQYRNHTGWHDQEPFINDYTFKPDASKLMEDNGIKIEVSRIAPDQGRPCGGLQFRFYKLDEFGETTYLSMDDVKGYFQ